MFNIKCLITYRINALFLGIDLGQGKLFESNENVHFLKLEMTYSFKKSIKCFSITIIIFRWDECIKISGFNLVLKNLLPTCYIKEHFIVYRFIFNIIIIYSPLNYYYLYIWNIYARNSKSVTWNFQLLCLHVNFQVHFKFGPSRRIVIIMPNQR